MRFYPEGSERPPLRKVTMTWDDIFFGMGEKLLAYCPDLTLEDAFRDVVFLRFKETDFYQSDTSSLRDQDDHWRKLLKLDKESLNQLILQLQALGLITSESIMIQRGTGRTLHSYPIRHWRLTEKGMSQLFKQKAKLKIDTPGPKP